MEEGYGMYSNEIVYAFVDPSLRLKVKRTT